MKHYTFDHAAVCLAGGKATREFFAPIFIDRERELLLVALCDDGLRLLQLVGFPGAAAYVDVTFADVMRQAVSSGCAGFVLAHNHPSADTRPSNADLLITRRFGLAAEALDITLLDHLIFNGGPAFSFREKGYL